MDVFGKIKKGRSLHPNFILLRDSPMANPARRMIAKVCRDLHDPDGNFIEQFQTFGFDARIFEMYLYALFKEQGHTIDRSKPRPDFGLTRDGVSAWVEAVIAGAAPTGQITPYRFAPKDRTPEEQEEYIRNEAIIRFASPLYTKLKKEYWKLPHVINKPLVLAIQSFSDPGSLLISGSPLTSYLYGLSEQWYHDEAGNLVITSVPIENHRVRLKQIPSGFFSQPGAENISGVLFSNCGTYAKFNRMGHQGEFFDPALRIIRYGTCYRHDPNATKPAPFFMEVGNPSEGMETWREGSVLIHNPNALHPLPPEWLGAGAEDNLENGSVVTTFGEPFLPYWSMTESIDAKIPQFMVEAHAKKIQTALLSDFPL